MYAISLLVSASADYGKSSPIPAMEAHSIQLHARDLSATRDNHLEVRSDGNDIHLTDYYSSDKGFAIVQILVRTEELEVSGQVGVEVYMSCGRSSARGVWPAL